MAERFFYYEPCDVTYCAECLANALAGWYPDDAEKCQGWDFHYVGYDIDVLVARLKRNTRNDFLTRHLTEVGVHSDADHDDPFSTCEGMH